MTLAQLNQYDGKDGRPAYVAVNNVIYDVSASSYWHGGNHFDAHQAGADLTEELTKAPHVRAVIERFPVVGRLELPPPAQGKKLPIASLVIMAAILLLLIATFL